MPISAWGRWRSGSLGLVATIRAGRIRPVDSLSPFLSLDGTCDEALQWLSRRLRTAGLRIMRTFDLKGARPPVDDCQCPHHGGQACDCQMLIALVYGEALQPTTLILHSNDGRTSFSLVNTPAQQADASIRSAIERALESDPREQGL